MASIGVAQAQIAPPPDKGYAEVVAQSAFGNVTSQSFGGEFGFTVLTQMQVFVEAGNVSNVAGTDISTSAQKIAGAISQVQTNVGYTVKQPVAFGVAGIKFLVPATGSLKPYIMLGGGAARVSQKATFTVAGTDVTGSLSQPQYGSITLGTDLTGSYTKAMLSIGGGVMWSVWKQMVIDVQYRYGRVFSDDGININRAGIGLGVRF
jgi:opacity protein-like surface antigen